MTKPVLVVVTGHLRNRVLVRMVEAIGGVLVVPEDMRPPRGETMTLDCSYAYSPVLNHIREEPKPWGKKGRFKAGVRGGKKLKRSLK